MTGSRSGLDQMLPGVSVPYHRGNVRIPRVPVVEPAASEGDPDARSAGRDGR